MMHSFYVMHFRIAHNCFLLTPEVLTHSMVTARWNRMGSSPGAEPPVQDVKRWGCWCSSSDPLFPFWRAGSGRFGHLLALAPGRLGIKHLGAAFPSLPPHVSGTGTMLCPPSQQHHTCALVSPSGCTSAGQTEISPQAALAEIALQP